MAANSEAHARRQQLRHPAYQRPKLLAEEPNQVWSWDITKFMESARCSYFYLYVVLNIPSRRVARCAAPGISLGGDPRPAKVLGTDPAEMGELVWRIAAPRTWPKGLRPHGVLALVAEGIESEALVLAGGRNIEVGGAISVFSPGRRARRRSPFIVAVLVALPDGQQPLTSLEAYAE